MFCFVCFLLNKYEYDDDDDDDDDADNDETGTHAKCSARKMEKMSNVLSAPQPSSN